MRVTARDPLATNEGRNLRICPGRPFPWFRLVAASTVLQLHLALPALCFLPSKRLRPVTSWLCSLVSLADLCAPLACEGQSRMWAVELWPGIQLEIDAGMYVFNHTPSTRRKTLDPQKPKQERTRSQDLKTDEAAPLLNDSRSVFPRSSLPDVAPSSQTLHLSLSCPSSRLEQIVQHLRHPQPQLPHPFSHVLLLLGNPRQ
jgi:hypothetical protein